MEFSRKYKPGVNKKILYFLAGTAWFLVGIMLIRLAIVWTWNFKVVFLISGFVSGVIIAKFGFGKIADKNIRRIKNKNEEKLCIFGFIAWRSYILIFIMITMGITLRHSSIPKYYLAVLYSAIGSGLFLSSFKYFIVSFA